MKVGKRTSVQRERQTPFRWTLRPQLEGLPARFSRSADVERNQPAHSGVMTVEEVAMPRRMISAMVLVGAAIAATAYIGFPAQAPAGSSEGISHASAARPVVLELFQSQGCSSCPPALAVLNEIANRPDVLALNFAVTYWDQLGWKDSFAQPAFSARQWEYARAGGRGNVQTPQLIVDGRAAILGSRKNEVEAAIASHRAAAGAPDVTTSEGAVTVGSGKALTAAKVWLVDYDPRNVAVPVRAGENGGRTLPHRNIVKRLTPLGAWTGKSATYPLPLEQSGLARAILVQSGTGGPILSGRKI
jgi:hypothetical protein